LLALGGRARGRAQHQVEDALAALLHGFLAVEDGAAVHVHVLLHAVIHGGVGRELDRWRRLAAEHAAAAGGEAHQIGPARHLPGGGHRVVARRVHEHEALLRHLLGIAHHIHQIGAAGLGHGAEGFLQDGGEPAGLVAGAGVGIHLRPLAGRVILPPAHQRDQLFADLAAGGAAG
jgi:hypothetical protein